MHPTDTGNLAKKSIVAPWDDLRSVRVQRRVLEELRVGRASKSRSDWRRVGRWFGAAVAVAALVALVVFVRDAFPTRSTEVATSHEPRLELADGSVVTLASSADGTSTARVVVAQVSSERIVVNHLQGTATYDIAKNPNRVFVVNIDDARVEVLGTSFRIEKLDHAVRVAVLEGRVQVTRQERSVVLVGGEDVTFGNVGYSPPAGATSRPTGPSAPTATGPAEGQPPSPSASAGPSASAPAAAPTAAQLFRQADDARGRGDVVEALGLLRKLVSDYPRDPRVGLAMFTIGRLEMQRGNPASAAEAFESCGAAMGGEAIAEAALARSRAGDAAKARALASEYLKRFPEGARAAEMEKLAR
ncbi:MAG: tetratricopeptide repeat protein [Polyangiaceae bacterium]|nr:tetratricopeptide repeat protein [Polyangiaceae bacterium]